MCFVMLREAGLSSCTSRQFLEQCLPPADSFAARQVENRQFIGFVRGLWVIHTRSPVLWEPTSVSGRNRSGYVGQTQGIESLQAQLKGNIGDFAPGKAPRIAVSKEPVDEFAKALEAAQREYDKFRKQLDDSLIKSMEDLSKELNQSIIDHQKYLASLKQQWLDYAQFVRKEMDQIVVDTARQSQPIPGGGTGIPGCLIQRIFRISSIDSRNNQRGFRRYRLDAWAIRPPVQRMGRSRWRSSRTGCWGDGASA
jgi:hypothetical protein